MAAGSHSKLAADSPLTLERTLRRSAPTGLLPPQPPTPAPERRRRTPPESDPSRAMPSSTPQSPPHHSGSSTPAPAEIREERALPPASQVHANQRKVSEQQL